MAELFLLLTAFPWVPLTCFALIAALSYFSDALSNWVRWLVGFIHFAFYFAMFFAVFLLMAYFPPFGSSPVLLVVMVSAAVAVLSTLIMGFYLLISLNLFRRHWNESFSSLRVKDHKGFLRLHLKDGVVTVYPVAIDKVPHGGRGALRPRLIERPIRVTPYTARSRPSPEPTPRV